MSETPYYAKDGKVWKRSVETKHAGGSSFTLGFPVCEMTEIVGADAADSIAGLMNLGDEAQNRPAVDELVKALEETVRVLSFAFDDGALDHETIIGLCIDPYGMLKDAQTILAKHKETTE